MTIFADKQHRKHRWFFRFAILFILGFDVLCDSVKRLSRRTNVIAQHPNNCWRCLFSWNCVRCFPKSFVTLNGSFWLQASGGNQMYSVVCSGYLAQRHHKLPSSINPDKYTSCRIVKKYITDKEYMSAKGFGIGRTLDCNIDELWWNTYSQCFFLNNVIWLLNV